MSFFFKTTPPRGGALLLDEEAERSYVPKIAVNSSAKAREATIPGSCSSQIENITVTIPTIAILSDLLAHQVESVLVCNKVAHYFANVYLDQELYPDMLATALCNMAFAPPADMICYQLTVEELQSNGIDILTVLTGANAENLFRTSAYYTLILEQHLKTYKSEKK